MSQIELIAKVVDLAEVAERSPAFVEEITALLGRKPMNVVKALTDAVDKFETFLPSELGETVPASVADGASAASSVNGASQIYKGIPELSDGFLPPGIHAAQWSDMVAKYSGDPNRSDLLPGMFHALHDLKEGGVKEAYLGGSFVTSKIKPNDFDISFERELSKTLPKAQAKVLGDRDLMKQAYGGECLQDHLCFFRQSRSNEDIGVLKFDLSSLAPRSTISPAYSVYDGWFKANSRRVTFKDFLSRPKTPKHFDLYTDILS
jgi:hypothetical protein